MARSLYAMLNRQFGKPVDALTRREMLKFTLAASAGMLLSRDFAFARQPAGRRVCVIGAGFSGLACAYELKAAGYDVTVIDARDRVGGRVLSFKDFIDGRNVEGGGELIGSNHPTWVSYADKFKLEWLDVSEDEGLEGPITFAGKRLTAEESEKLWEELDEVSNRMNEDAKPVDAAEPWKSPNAAALDARNTKQWIEELKDCSELCKVGLAVQFSSNNGTDARNQSYLGNLTSIKGGGLDKYWSESEVYRCKGGNQQLAFKLSEEIGGSRIVLGLPVTEIVQKGNKVNVTCRDGRVLEVDDVVLAVPPTTWSKIKMNPAIPPAIMPQMGIALKYLASVKKRFWSASKLSQYSLTDGPMSMTWEGTDAQEGDENVSLNCFSGGPAAEKCRAFPKDKRDAEYGAVLESLYPGFKENFVKSRFMSWPDDPWTLAGYSFPAPGQVTTVGPMLHKGHGKVHFAGEHCCYAFVGYMEGALNSGVSLAKRIAMRDGLAK